MYEISVYSVCVYVRLWLRDGWCVRMKKSVIICVCLSRSVLFVCVLCEWRVQSRSFLRGARGREWCCVSPTLHKQIILCKSFFFLSKGGQTNAFALVYALTPSTILTFCPSAPTHTLLFPEYICIHYSVRESLTKSSSAVNLTTFFSSLSEARLLKIVKLFYNSELLANK